MNNVALYLGISEGKCICINLFVAGDSMLYWIIYDITNDGRRTKVASKCKDYGFKRVQKSAFLGEISRNVMEMLAMEIKEIINNSGDCVFILPSCKECFGKKVLEGRLDEDSVRESEYMIIGG